MPSSLCRTPLAAPFSINRRVLLSSALLVVAPALHAQQPPPLMLARVAPHEVDPSGYWVSEKFDGVRAYWDGTHLRTRNGHRIAAPPWFTAGWPPTPLDGELWAGRGRFTDAASAAARDVPDDAAWRDLRYLVFDLPAHPGRFDDRLPALRQVIGRIAQPWLRAVDQVRVPDRATLQAMLARTVRQGGEGLMLHRGASLYRAGRSDDLLKLKPFDDAEATVVAHLPGQGRHAGRLGALLVQMPDGQRFRLGTGFSDIERDAPPPVGSVVTYRHRGLHPGGLPRFASFLRVRPM